MTLLAALSTEVDLRTLANEHAFLLRDVRWRATPILALVVARSWPEAELAS